VPKIIKIELDLTKLLKKNGAVFLTHSVESNFYICVFMKFSRLQQQIDIIETSSLKTNNDSFCCCEHVNTKQSVV